MNIEEQERRRYRILQWVAAEFDEPGLEYC